MALVRSGELWLVLVDFCKLKAVSETAFGFVLSKKTILKHFLAGFREASWWILVVVCTHCKTNLPKAFPTNPWKQQGSKEPTAGGPQVVRSKNASRFNIV